LSAVNFVFDPESYAKYSSIEGYPRFTVDVQVYICSTLFA